MVSVQKRITTAVRGGSLVVMNDLVVLLQTSMCVRSSIGSTLR